MAVALAKSQEEIKNMPLVDLTFEILRQNKEPIYFRDLMKEIQELRGMSEDEALKVIARLYTELNIDGRFLCLGQNVWGLKRWYPVDKTQEKSLTSKRFVRKSGDAFSDDDDDDDDSYDDDDLSTDGDVEEETDLLDNDDSDDDDDSDVDEDFIDEEDGLSDDDADGESLDDEDLESDDEDDDDEDEEF